jgi:hypothetical protein
MVVVKTPAASAMVGAQTTIINQLKAAVATAMETATMKGNGGVSTAFATAAARHQRGGGRQRVGGACWGQQQCGCSTLAAMRQRCWQHSGGSGSTPAAASLAAAVTVWRHCGISGSSSAAGAVPCGRSGVKDTGGNSNGGGTDNNQQSNECGGNKQQQQQLKRRQGQKLGGSAASASAPAWQHHDSNRDHHGHLHCHHHHNCHCHRKHNRDRHCPCHRDGPCRFPCHCSCTHPCHHPHASHLPLHAGTVATKTPASTAMARAQTTINNQMNAVATNNDDDN